MKLYYINGSGNSRKVLATARHLGIDLEIEYMDFLAGDLGRPDFLALNPNGRVPTLTDGDLALWESNAIMQYLADQVPGNKLLPQDPRTRADITRWQCWELAHFNQAFSTLLFETVLKPQFLEQPPNPVLVEHAQNSLREFAGVLETHLSDREYLVGNAITLADYSVIHNQAFKEAIPFDWKPFGRVNAYFDRMGAVPHWKNTAPNNPEEIGRKPSAA